MASIRRETLIAAPQKAVWSALSDVGALHTRLVRGFVVDCKLDGDDARIVTFANGVVARELIVDVDDAAARIAWTASGGRLTHHNASAQAFAEGAHATRVVWIADLMPHAMASTIAPMIEHGLAAMKATLEADAARA